MTGRRKGKGLMQEPWLWEVGGMHPEQKRRRALGDEQVGFSGREPRVGGEE